MSFFTDGEVEELRELSESAMDVTLRVNAPGGESFSEVTGRTTFAEGAQRFMGSGALRPLRPSRQAQVGEEERHYRRALIHIPHSASMPKVDDLVTIMACARNPALVTEVFRIIGVGFDSDLVSWELTVEHAAGSRTTTE